MANRNFARSQCLNRGEVVISGSFAPAGTGAVTDVKGIGFTVARTSAGLFTVTLNDKYVDSIALTAQVQMASATDLVAQVGAIDVVSARTVQVRTIDSTGTVQDISANANNRVHFSFRLKNSTVN